MNAARATTKVGRLERAGRLLYGERWQSPLARVVGISQSAISMMISGDRAVTDDVQRKLAAALKAEADRLRSSTDKIDRLRAEIENELE